MGAIFAYVQYSRSLQVIHQREILVPFAKRLLIDSQPRQRFCLPPFQTTLHRSLHDPVNLVPTQSQLLPHRLLTRASQPVNHQTLLQRRESARRFRPRQFHNSHTMLRTFGPRWPGVQYGLILAGIQMPPLPFPLMVIQLAVRAAFRAGPTRYLTVLQINVHFAGSQL